MMEENRHNFQVNLQGMISLLSEHIYSSPVVFIRELLQNGADAVTARRALDEGHQGALNIWVSEEGGLHAAFEDNGIGLSENDVHEFLSVIGQSSKRGPLAEKGYIGQFGIGLLSCFMVSDEIIVHSRSLITGQGVCWRGKSDGTYTVSESTEMQQAGTRVLLYPKKEWVKAFAFDELKKNILSFGSALPIAISLSVQDRQEALVSRTPVWLDTRSTKEELLEYGRATFNISFLDAFAISTEAGGLQGIGYIIPHKVQFSGTKDHKIYLKRMFLCEQSPNLFPEWASLIKCVINTDSLRPVASRESLMETAELKAARKELDGIFKRYLTGLTITSPHTLERIIEVHHLFIKALAAEDSEMLKTFINYLPFETSKGTLSFGQMQESGATLYYTPSLDDFRQIRRIAGSQGKTVINAAYSFEAELLRKAASVFPQVKLQLIAPQDVLSGFADGGSGDERCREFEKRAAPILKPFGCRVQAKSFTPEDTPVIYVASDQAAANKKLQDLASAANPFASTLKSFVKDENNLPTLCFNLNSKLVDDIMGIEDTALLEPVLHVMYVQALMLGNYPVAKREMGVFNDALYSLIVMGMANFSIKF